MELKANGIDISYEIEGDGPVVTFSHSLACNRSMWGFLDKPTGRTTL